MVEVECGIENRQVVVVGRARWKAALGLDRVRMPATAGSGRFHRYLRSSYFTSLLFCSFTFCFINDPCPVADLPLPVLWLAEATK